MPTTPAFNSSDTSEADVDYPELDLDKYTILANDYDPFGALLGEANSEGDSADELDMEAREKEKGGMNRWQHFYGCLRGGFVGLAQFEHPPDQDTQAKFDLPRSYRSQTNDTRSLISFIQIGKMFLLPR